jgi:hypothetical protein
LCDSGGDPPVPDQVESDHRREQLLEEITEWLLRVFGGYNPPRDDMRHYADKFYQVGFFSVAMIQQHCRKDHLAWMKPLHVEMLLDSAQNVS